MEISCLSKSLCQDFLRDKNFEYRLTDDAIYLPSSLIRLDIQQSLIIDLNDDCLEVILMNLNLKQLFDIICVHSRFLTACRRVFLKKFRHKEIVISAYQTKHPDYANILYLMGDVISTVRVTYDQCENGQDFGNFNNNKIHEAIISYCSETLTEITFNHIHPTMATNKPFSNLNNLNFNQGCVGHTMTEFNKWFPKLNSLQFFFCKIVNTHCIEQSFSNLEHFTVAHQSFTFENLCTFLDLNQQLKTFTVYHSDRNLIRQLEEYTMLKCNLLQTKFEVYPGYFPFRSD